jgi:hypothetical protein
MVLYRRKILIFFTFILNFNKRMYLQNHLDRDFILIHRYVLFQQSPTAERAKYLESVQQLPLNHHKYIFHEIENRIDCHPDWTNGCCK